MVPSYPPQHSHAPMHTPKSHAHDRHLSTHTSITPSQAPARVSMATLTPMAAGSPQSSPRDLAAITDVICGPAAICSLQRMAAAGRGLEVTAGPQRPGWSWRRARLRSMLILAFLTSYRISPGISDRLCSSLPPISLQSPSNLPPISPQSLPNLPPISPQSLVESHFKESDLF